MHSRDDLDDCAVSIQRLVSLLDRTEEFITQQVRRLEMMVGLPEHSSCNDTSRQATQVQTWRQLWEEERSAERRRIQEEGQLLIRAWKELEDEERRLLGMRESLAVHRAMAGESVNKKALSAEESLGVEEMALSQFQKLRREMQRHTRCVESA